MADARPRSLKTLFLLTIIVMIIATQAGRVSAQQSQYPTILIVNPLSPTNSSLFAFNSSAYPINSTFTAAIYINTVTNLSGWQVLLSWDNSIINFATAWWPTDNVFETAADNGATVFDVPASISYDNSTNTGYMEIGATTFYAMNSPPMYPVNVEGEGLLFDANFTIAATPNATQTLSTNLEILKTNPTQPAGYLGSFVFIYPSKTEIQVLTEPATVSISGSQAVTHTIVDVSVTGISCVDEDVTPIPGENPIFRGDNLTITTSFANNGTALETFNFNLTETFNFTAFGLLTGSMSLLPNSTDYYVYVWNIPGNLTVGDYTLEAQIQPLPGQNNTQYNTFTTVIHIDRRLNALEYTGYLLSIWLLSRLGILFMAYVVAVICFFSVIFARERLKMRRSKIR